MQQSHASTESSAHLPCLQDMYYVVDTLSNREDTKRPGFVAFMFAAAQHVAILLERASLMPSEPSRYVSFKLGHVGGEATCRRQGHTPPKTKRRRLSVGCIIHHLSFQQTFSGVSRHSTLLEDIHAEPVALQDMNEALEGLQKTKAPTVICHCVCALPPWHDPLIILIPCVPERVCTDAFLNSLCVATGMLYVVPTT